jgi:hypothetical protein
VFPERPFGHQKISFFGKLHDLLHNHQNFRCTKYFPTVTESTFISCPKKEIFILTSHQLLCKLSQKENIYPIYPINPYINHPKMEIPILISLINPYIIYPKKKIPTPLYSIDPYISYPKQEIPTPYTPSIIR